MARKGKHKKKKAKNYSKKKFHNIFCSICGICNANTSPDFCFPSIYKSNPSIFVSAVYPNLVDAAEYMTSKNQKPEGMSMTTFSQIFCKTGVCTHGIVNSAALCPSAKLCFDTFIAQVKSKPSKSESKFKIKKIKRKARQVYTPYPTFFTRQGEEFKKAVDEILNRDNNNEQDKDQELSTGSPGDADRKASD